MVTDLGTAKQTLGQLIKCDTWLAKCAEAGIVNEGTEQAALANAAAAQALMKWIKEQK